MHVLVTWIGNSDLPAAASEETADPGPVLRLLREQRFDRVHLLDDLPEQAEEHIASPAQFTAGFSGNANLFVDLL